MYPEQPAEQFMPGILANFSMHDEKFTEHNMDGDTEPNGN